MTTRMEAFLQEAEPAALEDRSGHTYSVVMQGLEEGLGDEAIRSGIKDDEPSVDKYGDRLTAEVDRILDKERPRHKHVGRSCRAADCTGAAASADTGSEVAEIPVTVKEVSWDEVWAGPLEPPRYLLEPLLPEGRTTTIYSPAKVGKSLLGLEIAAVLATGGEMWGQQLDGCDVLYLDMEMTHVDLRERLDDFGFDGSLDLSRLHYFLLEPWPPLDTAAGGRTLLDQVERTGAKLVVLDTQSKLLEGKEDDAGTMTKFFLRTLGPLKKLGTTVLIFDHAGRDVRRGTRGSSQKPADVDAVWQLTTRSKGGLTLKRTHNRTRHGQDILYLQREEEPLRHVVTSVDKRTEEVIQTFLEWMRTTGLDPSLSGREVLTQAKDAGLHFRHETIREAYRRYQQWCE